MGCLIPQWRKIPEALHFPSSWQSLCHNGCARSCSAYARYQTSKPLAAAWASIQPSASARVVNTSPLGASYG